MNEPRHTAPQANGPGEYPEALCYGCGWPAHEPNYECWWHDRSTCTYFQGKGTCSFDCVDEPSCITDRPPEGWPAERVKADGG